MPNRASLPRPSQPMYRSRAWRVALGVLVFWATTADSFQRNIVHIRAEARYARRSINRPAVIRIDLIA